ncbi:hypothetical protein HDF23_005833 [Mucilaginibacter lappiensis]|nr:hypothetical protein [Mucilaginibacter lappiensis]
MPVINLDDTTPEMVFFSKTDFIGFVININVFYAAGHFFKPYKPDFWLHKDQLFPLLINDEIPPI